MDQTTEPTREERIAALPTLPERTRYVYNRTAREWEGMFDGRVYVLAPHEVKPMDAAVAEHLRATSIITGTLRRMAGGGGTLTAERAVALGPGWAISGSAKIQDDFVLQYEEAAGRARVPGAHGHAARRGVVRPDEHPELRGSSEREGTRQADAHRNHSGVTGSLRHVPAPGPMPKPPAGD